MKRLTPIVLGVFILLGSVALEAEEASHYVGVESEFIRADFASGSTKHRLRVVGVWGVKPGVGLEAFLTYGDQQRLASAGGSIDTRLFSAGLGVRREHHVRKWLGFYHTLSAGFIDSSKGRSVFFQPKIGFTPHLTSRLLLDVNLAWTIQTIKTNGSIEHPFSVGLKFRI